MGKAVFAAFERRPWFIVPDVLRCFLILFLGKIGQIRSDDALIYSLEVFFWNFLKEIGVEASDRSAGSDIPNVFAGYAKSGFRKIRTDEGDACLVDGSIGIEFFCDGCNDISGSGSDVDKQYALWRYSRPWFRGRAREYFQSVFDEELGLGARNKRMSVDSEVSSEEFFLSENEGDWLAILSFGDGQQEFFSKRRRNSVFRMRDYKCSLFF